MNQPTLRVLMELGCSDTKIGAVNDMLDLAHFTRPQGVEITFCGPLDHETNAILKARGLRTVRGVSRTVSRLGLPLYAASVLWWMVRLLWLRPHVVHLNYVGWGPSLAYAAYLSGIPVVSRAGGAYDSRNLSNRCIKAYAASCLPHGQSLLESPAADKVFVLGDFFRPDRLDESESSVRPVPYRQEGRPLFVFLGQLVERKGVAILVQAFAAMKSRADLLLVGGNWSEDGYPRLVRDLTESLGLADRVFFENHRTDIAAVLKRCDVFVLPSLSDARPRSMIEAMMMGLPVISTRVGGIPTLVEDGVSGILVPPSDPDSLSAALDRLAESRELRKRFGDAGRARATEQCRPERTALRAVALYRQLATSQSLATMTTRARLDTGALCDTRQTNQRLEWRQTEVAQLSGQT